MATNKRNPESEVEDLYIKKLDRELAGKEAFDKIVTSILERVIREGRSSDSQAG